MDGGQHPEPQAIDLEEAERIEVVLVPLDDGAALHGRVLDGHEPRERAARDHEPADMLGEVAREPDDLPHQPHEPGNDRILGVQPDLGEPFGEMPFPSHQ